MRKSRPFYREEEEVGSGKKKGEGEEGDKGSKVLRALGGLCDEIVALDV